MVHKVHHDKLSLKSGAEINTVFRRPSAYVHEGAKLDLLEVCAYPGSTLSHLWAYHGRSAVRIAHRLSDEMSKSAPEPIKGQAITWYHLMILKYFLVLQHTHMHHC